MTTSTLMATGNQETSEYLNLDSSVMLPSCGYNCILMVFVAPVFYYLPKLYE